MAPRTPAIQAFWGLLARLAHVGRIAPRQQWFETLRLSIRQEHGKGWSIREIGATKRNPIGRCQLTRIWESRTRSSVVMPLEWKATNATAILATVGQLRALMEELNLSLQDALKLNAELLVGSPQVMTSQAGQRWRPGSSRRRTVAGAAPCATSPSEWIALWRHSAGTSRA